MGEKLNLRGEKLMDFVERQLEKEKGRFSYREKKKKGRFRFRGRKKRGPEGGKRKRKGEGVSVTKGAKRQGSSEGTNNSK